MKMHWCYNCKRVRKMVPYSVHDVFGRVAVRLTKDEKRHVRECSKCHVLIDTDDPRNKQPKKVRAR